MKKTVISIFAVLSLVACNKGVQLEVSNSLPIDRNEELVEISVAQLNYNPEESHILVDADGKDGDPVIVSLEADRSQIAEFEPELFSGSSSASSVPLSSSFTAAERVREARGNAVIREYVQKRYLLAPEDVEAVTSGRSAAAGEIRSLKEIARETVAAMLESRGEALPEAAGI